MTSAKPVPLRQLRKARGITQKAVAVHLGLPQSIVSDWENGRLKSWRDHEAALCELLGLPPLYLSRLYAGVETEAVLPPTATSLDVSEVGELLSVWAQIAPQDRRRALAVLKVFAGA